MTVARGVVPGLVGWLGMTAPSARSAARFAPARSRRGLKVAQLRQPVVANGLLTGLLAWWSCHENGGNPRADSSGNGKTASESGGTVAATAGLIGQAALFVGGGAVMLKTSGAVLTSSPFSMSCWANPVSLGGSVVLMGQKGINFGPNFIVTGTTTNFQTNTGQNTTTAVPLTVGSWNHVVGTYDGTTSTLYLNGTQLFSGAKGVAYPNDTFNIGGSGSGNNGVFDGAIQLAGLWSVALTPAKVSALYNGGNGLDYSSFTS